MEFTFCKMPYNRRSEIPYDRTAEFSETYSRVTITAASATHVGGGVSHGG